MLPSRRSSLRVISRHAAVHLPAVKDGALSRAHTKQYLARGRVEGGRGVSLHRNWRLSRGD